MYAFLFMVSIFVSSQAYASAGTGMECSVVAEVDEKRIDDHKIKLVFSGKQQDCQSTETYIIPGTQVELLVGGHGRCGSSEPSVGIIEAHDKLTGNYAKSYVGWRKSADSLYLQLITRGKPQVNLVVGCELVGH